MKKLLPLLLVFCIGCKKDNQQTTPVYNYETLNYRIYAPTQLLSVFTSYCTDAAASNCIFTTVCDNGCGSNVYTGTMTAIVGRSVGVSTQIYFNTWDSAIARIQIFKDTTLIFSGTEPLYTCNSYGALPSYVCGGLSTTAP